MSIAVLDCESTGLPSNPHARVVELAAVALDPHNDYAEVNWTTGLVRPAWFDPRDCAGLARSGITVDEVLAAPDERTSRREFYEWMAEHNVTEVFSYNRTFDETMLKRSGFVLPWTGCVMDMARKASGKKNLSLFQAAEFFVRDIPAEAPHRALPDARFAALLFAALRRRGF